MLNSKTKFPATLPLHSWLVCNILTCLNDPFLFIWCFWRGFGVFTMTVLHVMTTLFVVTTFTLQLVYRPLWDMVITSTSHTLRSPQMGQSLTRRVWAGPKSQHFYPPSGSSAYLEITLWCKGLWGHRALLPSTPFPPWFYQPQVPELSPCVPGCVDCSSQCSGGGTWLFNLRDLHGRSIGPGRLLPGPQAALRESSATSQRPRHS